MKEHLSASAFKNDRGSVVTIGTFDGVHIGHSTILKRLVETGKKDELDSVLLTFFPHPRMVLQKDSDLKLINTISEKKQLLEDIGLDHLVIHPFTMEFSRLTALEYVRDVLVNKLHAKKIIIGYDHRFGRNRTANIVDLRDFGTTYGFTVEEITAQELNDVAISSTKVRKALEAGDITAANLYLGYNFMITGTVTRGKGIGKNLGYPTANLKPSESYKLIPKKGVYLVKCNINGEHYFGLTNIGTNPTVGGTRKTIETYFMNLSKDLYDTELRIEFITHIRDEENFESVQDLITAIKNDEQFAINFLKTHE